MPKKAKSGSESLSGKLKNWLAPKIVSGAGARRDKVLDDAEKKALNIKPKKKGK